MTPDKWFSYETPGRGISPLSENDRESAIHLAIDPAASGAFRPIVRGFQSLSMFHAGVVAVSVLKENSVRFGAHRGHGPLLLSVK